MMTQKDLKSIVKEVCTRVNGYPPLSKDIRIFDAAKDGQYIIFGIGEFNYFWDGITLEKKRPRCRPVYCTYCLSETE